MTDAVLLIFSGYRFYLRNLRNLVTRKSDRSGSIPPLFVRPVATPARRQLCARADLLRAGIQTFAWVVNRSLLASGTRDPILATRAYHEQRCLAGMLALGQRIVLEPIHIPLISQAGV